MNLPTHPEHFIEHKYKCQNSQFCQDTGFVFTRSDDAGRLYAKRCPYCVDRERQEASIKRHGVGTNRRNEPKDDGLPF